MKFGIKNLGPIKDANIEIGDITIICGKNNTGKTYLTYTLYSFLHEEAKNTFFEPPQLYFDRCYKTGQCDINCIDLFESFCNHIKKDIPHFVNMLPLYLAKKEDTSFKNTDISFVLEKTEINDFIELSLKTKIQFTENCSFILDKPPKSQILTIRIENLGKRLPRKKNLNQFFNILCSFVLCRFMPDVFSLTGERSGISIFADYIADFSRSMLGKPITPKIRKDIQAQLEKRILSPFPLPIIKELEFFQRIKTIRRNTSFVNRDFPLILKTAEKIAGGHYDFEDQRGILYYPENCKESLSLVESSSSVKSLVEFVFYLTHCARKRQILMIDEPELNLHPENQRRFIQLLCSLAKIGIRVFITTHSDYIIREINTMVMLGASSTKTKGFIEQKYKYNFSLSPDQIRVYEAHVDGVLTPADLDPELGTTISDMDSTIIEMSHIQRDILRGE